MRTFAACRPAWWPRRWRGAARWRCCRPGAARASVSRCRRCSGPGVALVVSPLIALMSDQVEALKQAGVAAARMELRSGCGGARGDLAADRRGRARSALRRPRRADERRGAEPPQGPRAVAHRHRRGALRQPVGPRLSARLPVARPSGRALPRRPAPGVDRHGRRPHPGGHPRPAASGRTPASSWPVSRGRSWRCSPSTNSAAPSTSSIWSRLGPAARASSTPGRARARRRWRRPWRPRASRPGPTTPDWSAGPAPTGWPGSWPRTRR